MTEVKKNTIILDGKEISWDYTICPCLECEIYLSKKKSEDDKACRSVRCTYNSQLARDIANDIFFIMNHKHCENCNIYVSKEDYRFNPCCPNCGSDLN